MLKVVGASWDQIRLSWWLLGGVAMLGLVAVYCGGRPRVAADGNYAATVSWNPGSGFRCEYFGQNNIPDSIKKGVARAYYQSQMADSGFSVVEIETQQDYPDFVQAYAAGYLEGSLTWQLIYWHWQNTVQQTCVDREEYCETIRKSLEENTAFIRQIAARHHKADPFWHQIKLFYDQLDGLMYGWMAGVKRSRREVETLTLTDFLWINIASDLRDFEKKFNSSRDFNPSKPSLALAFVKLLPNDFSKFVLGHSSAGTYSGMLRVQKKYTFGYHRTGSLGSNLASGQVLLFTSYPGSLHSQDDLYLIASDKGKKSFIVGTAIQNYNASLWERTHLTNQILVGPRILAANRLATDGETWSKIAARENSGSGNKQWLLLRPEKDAVRVWVTEIMPGISVSREVTQLVREKGFWISSNRPHFQEIISVSESPDQFDDNSTMNEHNGSIPITSRIHHNPAVNTLIDGQANVTDLASLIALMKSPDLSIVGRSDLFGVRDAGLFYSLLSTLDLSKNKLEPDQRADTDLVNRTTESLTGDVTGENNQTSNQNETASVFLSPGERSGQSSELKRKTPDQNNFDSDLTTLSGGENELGQKNPRPDSSKTEVEVQNQDISENKNNAESQNPASVKASSETNLENWHLNLTTPGTAFSSETSEQNQSSTSEIDQNKKKTGFEDLSSEKSRSNLEGVYNADRNSPNSESSKLNPDHAISESELENPASAENKSDLGGGELSSDQNLSNLESKFSSKNIHSNEVFEDERDSGSDTENTKNEEKSPTPARAHSLFKKDVRAGLEVERTLLDSDSVDYATSSENSRNSESDSEDEVEVIRISNDDDDDDDDSDSGGRYQSDKTIGTDSLRRVPSRFSFIAGGSISVTNDAELNVDYSGLIDIKVISSEFDLRVATGPPFSSNGPGKIVEPFQWSKSFIKNTPHIGHVDTWDYDFNQPQWAWPLNFTENFAG